MSNKSLPAGTQNRLRSPILFLLLGVVLLYGAIWPPEPNIGQLERIEGDIHRFAVVNDWYGRPKRIDFDLYGNPAQFWTDRLPFELTSKAPSVKLHLEFFVQTDGGRPKKNFFGTVKAYGLTINGREIISAEAYLEGEGEFRRYIMLPIASVWVAISGGVLLVRYRRRKAAVFD